MWNDAVITNAGKELLAQWLHGGNFNLDSAATGQGTVPASLLMGQTELVNQKQAMSIISMEKVEGGIRVQLQLTSRGITNGYTINQIGLWASLSGGTSTLLAIYQDATGISVPTEAEMPDYVFTFYATLQMHNDGDITVTVDTSAFVTQADKIALDAAKADKVENATPGNFASLDANGNLQDSGSNADSFDAAGSAAAVEEELNRTKASKVTGAIAGHFAGLDSNGELTDSGKQASDFDAAGSAAAAANVVQQNLDAHEAERDNPHGVTAAQLGFDIVLQFDSEGYPCYKIIKS